MIFQACLLDDRGEFVPLGDPFEARTCLEAVQQAREYWPGLHPVIEESDSPVKLLA